MTGDSGLVVSRGTAAAAVALVLLIGAGGTYLLMRHGGGDAAHTPANAPTPGASSSRSPGTSSDAAAVPSEATPRRGDVVITLSSDLVERAGLATAPVSTAGQPGTLRLPGVVEPNAYRQVAITPLVGGRIVRVSVQLGDRVRRGQPLAEVYSPELADARTRYVAARSMLEAHDRELQRTEKLVAIGAASRQELERVHAEHAAQTAEVESARSRLQLLGAVDPDRDSGSSRDLTSTTVVRAPIDGLVTERLANAGLNVDPATKLFGIVDLSTVWIIANIHERDLHALSQGAGATVTTTAYPDRSFAGRVGYIDPQLDPATRTAKVRVEVTNPRGELRLGMYADVVIATTGTGATVSVPRSAVQDIGDRRVVYLTVPNEPAKFLEREVRLGRSAHEMVDVLSGLAAGDTVVTAGSFFLRAEGERLGRSATGTMTPDVQQAKVVLTEKGYEPATVNLRAGVPARITFLRTTDKTCGTEVVFPSLKIRKTLPLNEPVVIEIMPAQAGTLEFVCGMGMLKGTVVVAGHSH